MSTPPPPKNLLFFICTRGGWGRNDYALLQMLFWCSGICKSGIFAVADAFFDAVVSARVGYSLLRMLFSCQSCIIASAIYLFHDLQILTSTKLHLQPTYSTTWRCFPLKKFHPQFTYFKTCRCFCSKNNILNLLILRLVDTSPQFLLICVLWNIKLLTLHTINFVIWYHYIFRGFLFSEFSKP